MEEKYLQDKMSDDPSKCYHLIDQIITASERVNERSEHPTDGCMYFHMIAVSKRVHHKNSSPCGGNKFELRRRTIRIS